MLFNIFPMLLTLKVWLILQAALGCLAFISTVLIVNFINLEFFDKVEKEALEERKRNNLLFLSIPLFLIICVVYALYVDNFFYMRNEGFVYDFLLSISSFPLVPLAILCGSQILDSRCISREKSKIIKSKNIYDGDLHEVVDRSNVDDAGSPLIDYVDDGQQEYAIRLKNSDRGIVRCDQNLGTLSEHKQMDYILDPNEILKFEDNHAVIIYQGRYQKFHLSKYWEYYDTDFDVETIKKVKSDFV